MGDFRRADFSGNHEAVVGVENQTALGRLDGELLDGDAGVGHLLQFFVGGRQFQIHARILLSPAIDLELLDNDEKLHRLLMRLPTL